MGLWDRLPRVSPTTYRWITLATLVSLVFITVSGGAVRLTGSGLGCSTWPQCEPGSLTPRSASDMASMIEFGNRMVSGLVALATLATVVGARRRTPLRSDLVQWSWQVFGWVMVNAVVGGIVVRTHLLPATVLVHFLLSLAAIWSAVVLHHKAGQAEVLDVEAPDADVPVADADGTTATVPDAVRRAGSLLLVATSVTIVLGTVVTASGPHAGDEEVERLSLDVGEVARVHGISAAVLLAISVGVTWLAYRSGASAMLHDRLRWLTFVLLAQGAIGYVQYFSDIPPLLVGAHILGAALVWIAVLRVWLVLQHGELVRDGSTVDSGGADARDWERCPAPQPQLKYSRPKSTSRSATLPPTPTAPGS